MMFHCKRDRCGQRFQCKDDLLDHMASDPNHEYCVTCDLCFSSWDELTEHKTEESVKEVANYREWEKRAAVFNHRETLGEDPDDIDDEREQDPKPEMLHLCCKKCGADFKSIGGRDTHLKQMHPLEQDIRCPGCRSSFPSGSGLIHHLESDQCPIIDKNTFMAYVTWQNLVQQLMQSNETLALQYDPRTFLNDPEHGVLDGGVQLEKSQPEGVDQQNPNQPKLTPMQPEVKEFPKLPSTANVTPDNRQQQMADLMAGLQLTAKAATLEVRPLLPPSKPLDANTEKILSAWNAETRVAEKLFPNAKGTSTPQTKTVDELETEDKFDFHSLNPMHQLWNAERMFNTITEKYDCPFPGCKHLIETPSDLKTHLTNGHIPDEIRCVTCLKFFRTHYQFVGHIEAKNGRCNMPNTKQFTETMEKYTGGFISMKKLNRADMDRKVDGTNVSYIQIKSKEPAAMKKVVSIW